MSATAGYPGQDDLRRFLTYSLGLHLSAAALALAIYGAAKARESTVYMIDFVGPSTAILSAQAGPAAASQGAAPKLQPQTQADEFSLRRKAGAPLPRPSLLRGWSEPKASQQPEPAAAAVPESQPAQTGAPSAGGTPGQAGLATDLPNFPYPWYLAQLRQALWEQWSQRMPKQAGECVVVFSLLPNGRFADLRTEESSGDPAFDLAALSAVQDGAPYPPLPRGFSAPFLKIHLSLKGQ